MVVFTNYLKVFFFTLFLVFSVIGFSQNQPQVYFRSQGGESSYKLLWAPTFWPEGIAGFNVKRKTKNGDWEKLNQSTIIPGTDSRLDLNYVTNSSTYLEWLRNKYDSLISNNNIRSMSFEDIYESFLSDSTQIKFLKFLASVDFDFALIHGYAYYDTDIPKADYYTYGLFSVNQNGSESDQPLETVRWEYGSQPQYELESSYELKKIRRKRGIQVIWEIPTATLAEYDIKGFHIYRTDSLGNRVRVTDSPTRVNMAMENAPLAYQDVELDATANWTFEAVPIDIFGTAGSPLEAPFTPDAFPEITNFILKIEESDVEDASVSLFWELDHKYDNYLERFTIYRRKKVTEPKNEIAQAEVGLRKYQDLSITNSGYYFYQVEVITQQGERFTSNEQMVYKQLVVKPETPEGLRGSVVSEKGIDYVFLRWDPKKSSDTLTVGYQLYIDGVMSNGLAKDGSVGMIEKPGYKFEILPKYGKNYHFAVSGLSTDGTESHMSDTLEIFVPSKSLPEINIWPVDRQENIITLNWNYVDFIEDLKGFRLYQNGKLIANENDISADSRQWVSPELEPGKYQYQMEAVSKYGVVSQMSQVRFFNIKE